MPTSSILTASEAASHLDAQMKSLLPDSRKEAHKPLTARSVARLCKLGEMPGAYMAQGIWCIPFDAVEKFVKNTLGNNDGRAPRTRRSVATAK